MYDVVIMCAGYGKRLGKLTDDKPKAMIELKGKPIISWLYDNIKKVDDIGYIYLISGYRYNILEPYVKTYIDSHIRFRKQNPVNGTANAISLVENFVSEEFIVLAGDTIFNSSDIKKLVDKNNSLLYTEQKDRLYEFGTLDFNGDLITHINEKSSKPTSNLVNCSAYHFDSRIFRYIRDTPIDNRFNEKIITNSVNMMIDDNITFSGIKIDKLLEVSYPEDIEEVEKEL
jgi:glucose-1-phosphate thymidylyltransferase